MDKDILLFYLNNKNKELSKPVKSIVLEEINWLEKDLEDLVAKNIGRLLTENQLLVLSQSSGGEKADIFALDKDGTLYIFELKRWKSNKENILQVLRYGQKFGQYPYELLEEMLRNYKKDNTINLQDKHYEHFFGDMESTSCTNEQSAMKLEKKQFNHEQRFVVITNGLDAETLDAIKYWQNKGLQIEGIIYRVYEVGDEYLFEFNPYNPYGEVLTEREEGFFIVNTNLTWSEYNYKEMLRDEKAAAYFDRKYGIARIKKGDTVFLYHRGLGVIAYGKAISEQMVTDVSDVVNANDGKAEEYYIKLSFDWKIDPDLEPGLAISPTAINKEMKSGYRFRQTVFSISSEMSEVITDLIAEARSQ